MKILIVGNVDGWMAVHLRQLGAGFEAAGCKVRLVDYNSMRHPWQVFSGSGKLFESRQRILEKTVRSFQPGAILFIVAKPIFDFARIRSCSSARIVLYDYDGPNWSLLKDPRHLNGIDLLLTVSRRIERDLKNAPFPVLYLPHGTDCSYYSPGPRKIRFSAPVSYIGRATPRRADFCRSIADKELALYGRRWLKLPECRDPVLRKCIRSHSDIIGENVVHIYRSSGIMINILQENLAQQKTIMSLQVFAIPATAACLITEDVEELGESFEIGRELLAFRTKDEMVELLSRSLADPEWAGKIGEAGRRRCLAEHTHKHRAERILAQIR